MVPRTNRYASSSRRENVRSRAQRERGVPRVITIVISRVAIGLDRIFSAIMLTERLVGVAVFHRIQGWLHRQTIQMVLSRMQGHLH